MSAAFRAELLDAATAPYRRAGRVAWHVARSKLGLDPVYLNLIRGGLIPDRARILDLGCGRGLLGAFLAAADQLHARGRWPQDWPPPPRAVGFQGIEVMARDVSHARRALGPHAAVQQGDIRSTAFHEADVVVMLDVLHYVDTKSQDEVLARVRAVLAVDGILLLRVGDASAGLPFRLGTWIDQAVAFARSRRRPRLYCRPATAWVAALERLGFGVEAMPMSAGTLFANVLLVARPRPGLEPQSSPAGP